MITLIEPFGYHISTNTIGEAWHELFSTVLEHGAVEFDEGRERLALQMVRIHSKSQNFPDAIIQKFGNEKNLQSIIELTFGDRTMYDVDVVKSFTVGAKSYFARLEEGRMVEFVVDRLSIIPESKKAVIVFPTYEDYRAILTNHTNDYLPCIVSIQYRMRPNNGGWLLNTIFNMRSLDAYQKAHGNLAAMAILTSNIAEQISKRLGVEVVPGTIDGLIVDAHIYNETVSEAKDKVQLIKSELHD